MTRRPSEPHTVTPAADPVAFLAWCLGIVADYASRCRPCRSCGALVSTRYAFGSDCTACAIKANATSPDVIAWRDQQRQAARDRIAEMKRRKAAGA